MKETLSLYFEFSFQEKIGCIERIKLTIIKRNAQIIKNNNSRISSAIFRFLLPFFNQFETMKFITREISGYSVREKIEAASPERVTRSLSPLIIAPTMYLKSPRKINVEIAKLKITMNLHTLRT